MESKFLHYFHRFRFRLHHIFSISIPIPIPDLLKFSIPIPIPITLILKTSIPVPIPIPQKSGIIPIDSDSAHVWWIEYYLGSVLARYVIFKDECTREN